MLLCAFWRWGAVLHVNIIVSIGIKLASGKMKLLFITAVPNTKLCAWGEEDSGGHVL